MSPAFELNQTSMPMPQRVSFGNAPAGGLGVAQLDGNVGELDPVRANECAFVGLDNGMLVGAIECAITDAICELCNC